MSRAQGGRRKIKAGKSSDLNSFRVDVAEEIKELFKKTMKYVKPQSGDWDIPDPSESFTPTAQQHSCLQALKNSLNAVKNQLSDKNLEVWHQHTSFTNRAGKIIAEVRAAANAEICTQAWCKFYEILSNFHLIPEKVLQCGKLNSVHLCEAPGAFIASLNHYLKANSFSGDWQWVANTLNPYHEGNSTGTMITDDRLIINTLPCWFFGSENTGDIMLQKHLLQLQDLTRNMSTVDLVTADGSFDCQGSPDEQEALVTPLHYCETVAALLLLGVGGSFVLKMFTFYEHSSVCLLYLLNCCFREVNVFKPATSKAGNSEVYVVCLDYCRKEAVRPLLSKMIRNFGPDITSLGALFPNSLIPESFLTQHKEICQYFHKYQVQTINENLQLFQAMSAKQQRRLEQLRNCAVKFYLRQFRVQYLQRSKWISKNVIPGCAVNCKLWGRRKQSASFNERKEQQSMTWREKVLKGCYRDEAEEHALQGMGTDCVLEGPAEDTNWDILLGPELTTIRSTPFCDLALLSHLNEALEQSELGKCGSAGPLVHPCSCCTVLMPPSILSEVLKCNQLDNSVCGQGCQCVVVGSSSLLSHLPEMDKALLKLTLEPPCRTSHRRTLHDGEPRYQHAFLTSILHALQSLQVGASLVVPMLSAFTRVTAGLVLALHQCFRSVTFRCPISSDALGPVAMLLCIDYQQQPNSKLLTFLEDMQCQMSTLLEPDSQASQILQIVSMEVLLKGALPEFLWNMNMTIARYKLHLLMEAEQSLQMQRARSNELC
ncbi:cap-specific mRNA (nucleoside-2'-O-)-methyltransferase 2 isoform X2 [Brienomyrus brachyistius]|nr:cap-specific mRNA (nucleoside-2'-O-)-methyltransferase 2 isoform X2 [Brienomyrus brachyistius]XP_048828291.1 cap-specific mRNA (nucleoside-2'-O-)-methyltransferase 2 isoform X2 [Brienomyrus brachyistius]XP_048828292.1 cap-specific mRNA (nucleoside-2'-O-)-methyltransferase 2 isoform X2 [Brienomyrus brachyistius]